MKVINMRASFGFVGAVHEDQMEVPDGYTEEDINEEVWNWAQQFVDTEWEEEVLEDAMD